MGEMGRKKQDLNVQMTVTADAPLTDEYESERWQRAWLLLDEIERRMEAQPVEAEKEAVEA